ncbi:hypothetical protein [Haloglomus litoreum]|uniref:hypothetical protein n=1 Tax=Haloglomus litoreum TaxID=3034026 RepID=UPI0023E7EE04|nr:hypothetical protein [Haloglomus sp. DT116]
MSMQQHEIGAILQQVKGTMVLFLATGVGMGIGGWALLDAVTSGSGGGIGASLVAGLLLLSALVAILMAGPVVGAISGVRAELETARSLGLKSYGITGVTVLVGHIAMVVLAFFITVMGVSTGDSGGGGGGDSGDVPGVGDYLTPIVLGGLGAAFTAVAAQYAYRALAEQ